MRDVKTADFTSYTGSRLMCQRPCQARMVPRACFLLKRICGGNSEKLPKPCRGNIGTSLNLIRIEAICVI